MRNQIIVHTMAASISVLIISAGCSTNDSNPPDAIGRTENERKVIVPNRIAKLKFESRTDSHSTTPSNTVADMSSQPSPAPLAISPSRVNVLSESITRGKLIPPAHDVSQPIIENTEKYQNLDNNPVIRVADQSTSTFSIDVDTGAYSNVRRFLNSGQLPTANAVRIEELLNYFSYDYAAPESTATPFSIHTELSSTPWNNKTRLLHIGLKGFNVDSENRPTANLVFLLDVSGSMGHQNKLGLLKSSINMLTKDLTENDKVSIVVYAGASGVVLEPTAGNNSRAIRNALKKLSAGGSTNGEAGIELAYSLAEKSMKEDSINRIILATDGDFNVGISDIDKLKQLIEQKRESGIALTTLGFGQGNYNDHLMEQLANVGNGNYAYIDTLNEARKVLSEELTSTLLTIAKDVKIQIEFNPAQVSEYRLLGYVNRKLANEDFANDNVDAGEIGAGHTVTALYEIALIGEGGERNTESRYQKPTQSDALGNEVAQVRLRFKMPDEDTSQLTTRLIKRDSLISDVSKTSENFRFSAAVAGFAQLLRHSKYLNDFSYNDAALLATTAKGTDRFGYRSEFVQLVDLANNLDEQNQVRVQAPNQLELGEGEG